MTDLRKPPWLKKRMPSPQDLARVRSVLGSTELHTVCQEARCPNLGECFSRGTATILLLGRICTRDCGFCAVEHGTPNPPDGEEPGRIARAVKEMGLRYVVLTSVTRDDLEDGGASHFARAIRALRTMDHGDPAIRVEVLIPDFKGEPSSLGVVLKEAPDVLNHNVETVSRLYPRVRPQADYETSLELLRRSKGHSPRGLVKSGFMVGLGETRAEIIDLLRDLREAGCDVVTIGQYLQPRPDRLPVERYIAPDEFDEYRRIGEEMGFSSVASGPFVRSSYHAARVFADAGAASSTGGTGGEARPHGRS